MTAPALCSETRTYGCAESLPLKAEVHCVADPNRRLGKAVLVIHGGAWCSNDRHTPLVLCRHLALAGYTVLSLDFRDGRNGKHPCAVQDITAGVRYVRSNAAALGVDAERIGLIGSSSGGHLVLASALQPDLPEHRGTSVYVDGQLSDAADVSAAVRCVVALWPVSDPLQRFRYALQSGREELVAAHRRYYRDESHMLAASVQRMLREGEAQALPPLLLVQPGEDANVPRGMTLDLLREYQNAGGELHYLFYPGLPHAFAYQESPDTSKLAGAVVGFLAGAV